MRLSDIQGAVAGRLPPSKPEGKSRTAKPSTEKASPGHSDDREEQAVHAQFIRTTGWRLSDTPRIGVCGTGRVFIDNTGRLNLTEQGINAASITVRYRAKGSDRVWSNPFTLGAADRFRPGWFTFDPTARGMAANTPYEYEIVTKEATAKELNHACWTTSTLSTPNWRRQQYLKRNVSR